MSAAAVNGIASATIAGCRRCAIQVGITRTVTTDISSPTEITRSSVGASGYTALNG